MWNDHKSIILSKLCVLFFAFGLLGVVAFAPALVRWLLSYSRAYLRGLELHFLVTIYGGSLPAAILLYNLYRLLERIAQAEVFIPENALRLRTLSWCAAVGAGIALAASLYYFPWLMFAIPAAFMSLILRVIQNVFSEAVSLKQEVDYTV
ncbi:MAG: DUF2975 domain-containing protein [Firmicutes bacterium]|nr:DUF2975 domain-containing protein [Dethiobacter sp.]MBS3887784.1 DUF2975 domain-containing protein [Bacillota bacterium]